MSVQSGLRGLYIFKSSCPPFLCAFIQFSGLHEIHITTVGAELLDAV